VGALKRAIRRQPNPRQEALFSGEGYALDLEGPIEGSAMKMQPKIPDLRPYKREATINMGIGGVQWLCDVF